MRAEAAPQSSGFTGTGTSTAGAGSRDWISGRSRRLHWSAGLRLERRGDRRPQIALLMSVTAPVPAPVNLALQRCVVAVRPVDLTSS